MDISFELTPTDIVTFNVYLYDNLPKLRKRRQILRFAVPAFWLAVMGIFLAVSPASIKDRLLNWLPLLVISVLWLIFYPGFARRNFKKAVEKMYSKGKDAGIRSVRMSITPESVIVNGASGRVPTAWKDIKEVNASGEYLYMLTDTTTAHLVPLRAFGDPAKFNEFVETVKEYHRAARNQPTP